MVNSQIGTSHFKEIEKALSALFNFKVDGALRRVGGENDYIYYAVKRRIHKIFKK